jgi:hypothetical protein
MNLLELYDQIHSWIWRFENRPFPVSTDLHVQGIQSSIQMDWDKEMLRDVEIIEIPTELTGTIFEYQLRHVITLAKEGNISQLEEIHHLLSITEIYLDSQLQKQKI